MFLIIAAAILLLSQYYLWRRAVLETRFPGVVRNLLTAALVLGCLSIIGALSWWRINSQARIGPLIFGAFVWLGSSFYLLLFWIGFDLFRIARWSTSRVLRGRRAESTVAEPEALSSSLSEDTAPTLDSRAAVALKPRSGATQRDSTDEQPETAALDRRAFLSRAFAGISTVSTVGVAHAGVNSALTNMTEPEIEVRLKLLPPALDGFRIVHLTDLHIGPLLDRRFVRGVVERVNRLRPQLVAITGDLVDGPVSSLRDELGGLLDLRSDFGTYFVTGNHEFYVGARAWVNFLPRLGVRVLDNERVAIGSRPSASFDLCGIHDPTARRLDPSLAPDIDKAADGRDPSRLMILLAHQPGQVWAATNSGASLHLCGHTHGGQLWPFGAIVLLSQPYLAGLHQHDPNTQIYVSRGVGFWGPPMRVLAPAEIATIVLRCA